jgi:diguanylate cyclase (GGDEF)-like protein
MTNKPEGRIPLDDLLVFHKLARSLASSFDLDTILRTILEHMERLVEAELWMLLMLDEAKQELYCPIAAGGEHEDLKNLHLKVGEGVAGWVMEHGETLIVPESVDDPRISKLRSGKPRIVRSAVALPLKGRKGTHGVIEVFNPHTDQMNDYTIAFLHILADHAAIAIENARDVARIQQLTITDDCTGLYNARHLYDVLSRELDQCRQQKQPVSLAFLDLDRFKLVNDAHGHLVGSELLARTGQRLQELSRKQDWCFRYGGDEFVILMPETNANDALQQACALHHALVETPFQLKNEINMKVSASVGIATAPGDGATVSNLISIADARMYTVKSTGRGRVQGA